MKKIDFFETVLVTLNKDLEVSNQFTPIDKTLFVKTGVLKKYEHGKYKTCILKKDSPVYVAMTPDGVFNITDSEDSFMFHAEVDFSDFTLPKDMEFVQKKSPVIGKPGLFR